MAGPDEGDEEGQADVGPEPDRAQGERKRVGVNHVVTQAPDARAAEISDRGQIRREREEQLRRALECEIAANRESENRQSFDSEGLTRVHVPVSRSGER